MSKSLSWRVIQVVENLLKYHNFCGKPVIIELVSARRFDPSSLAELTFFKKKPRDGRRKIGENVNIHKIGTEVDYYYFFTGS